MTSLWARLEPLLAQVQKPARYIGCEDGALTPARHPARCLVARLPRHLRDRAPNQGLQILYEILNERADAVAERTYAPWRDLAALLRRTALPLSRSTPTAPPATSTCWRSTCRPSSSTPTCSTCIDLAGVPVRLPIVGPSTRSSSRRPLHLQPRAARRLPRLRRARRGRGGRRGDHEVVGDWARRRADRDPARARPGPRRDAPRCQSTTTARHRGRHVVLL